MFFDALWNGPHQTIKVAMFHDSPQHLVPSGLSWISPLVSTTTDSQLPSIEVSSDTMLTPSPVTPSDVVEDGDLAQADVKRRKLSGFRWRSIFHRQIFALRHKSKGSPLSKDKDFYDSGPLHHPDSEQQSPINNSLDISPSLDDSHISSSQLEQDTPLSSPTPEKECSRSPSLVPTIIASRPPSPPYHSCIAEAEALGIKVRDFAHEDHGVTLAPSIPDIGQLKASYNLYRKAGLTPPSETIRKLQIYASDWLVDAQRRYEILSIQSKPTCGLTVLSWMQETEKWSGLMEGESTDLWNANHSDDTGSTRMESASL